MRLAVVALVLSAASLASLAQVPKDCECPPAVAERLSKVLTPAAAKTVLQCSKNQPNDCEINVAMSGSGESCLATLNYCVICVRPKDVPHGQAKYYPKVRWHLKEGAQDSKKFVFNSTKGIDIPDAGVGGKEHFKDSAHDGGKNKFKWNTGRDYSGPLDHAPVVYPRDSQTACKWVDPIIVNSDQ